MSVSCPATFEKVWWNTPCFHFHRYELPPTRSREYAASRLTHSNREYAWCPPSCWTLKAIAVSATASDSASGTASHSEVVKNTSRTYDAANQPRMIAVLRYICQQSRSGLPVRVKYAATRFWSSAEKPTSSRGDFRRRS